MWLQLITKWDKWEEKLETTPCSGHTPYVQFPDGTWRGGVFGAQGVEVESFRCVSALGFTRTLIPEIITKRCIVFCIERVRISLHNGWEREEPVRPNH